LTRLWRTVIVVALFGIAVAVLVPSSVSSAFLGRLSASDMSLSGGNAFDRANLYAVAMGLVGKMPILGYGARMMTVFNQSFVSHGYGSVIIYTHSLYTSILLSTGFLGLVSLAWLTVAVVAMPISWTIRRRGASPELRALGGILAVVMLVWAVNEAKSEFIRQSFYVDLMAFTFGIVSSHFWLSRRSSQAHESPASSNRPSAMLSDGGMRN
jgi:hypothetical protein